MKQERHTHESYAQISFSRINGNANFYGSELQQDHYISMEIHQSEIQRDLTQDRYYTTGPMVLRLRMTNTQFSELITSLNYRSGVPCTLEIANGKKIEDLPPIESRKEFVHKQFKERMKTFANTIKDQQLKAKELVKKKTLSKQDINDLNMHLEWLTQEITSNIPYLAECFQETMDHVVLEAKQEVESAIQHKITTLGMTALHEQNKLLTNDRKNENS